MTPQRVLNSALRVVAPLMFGVYVAWNIYHLTGGRLPPSLMKGIFGLPAPTTGGTRSIRCLLRGDFAESLHWNAMALPILAVFFVSVGILLLQLLRRRPLRLPSFMNWSWFIVLVTAWVLKLTGSPAWW